MARRRKRRRRSSCCTRGSAASRYGATFRRKLAAATGWGVFAYSRAGYGQSDPVDLPRPLDYMTREARLSLPDGARGDPASSAEFCSVTATAPRSRRSTPASTSMAASRALS